MSALHAVKDCGGWAEEVFGGAELSDPRRTRRLVTVASQLAGTTGQSLAASCGGDAAAMEGAYRLARNKDVTPEGIAESGFLSTVKDAAAFETLLAVEDSSVLSYSHAAADELGDVGGKEASKARGFWVHTVLLVDAASHRTVGLVDQRWWTRDPDERGKQLHRRKRPYEERESFKWQEASTNIRGRLGPLMPRVVSVCDREADIYPYLAHKMDNGERFLVRASSDRRVVDDDDNKRQLLEVLDAAPACGKFKVEVPQRGGRPHRTAKLTLRKATMDLVRPQTIGSKYPARLSVSVLLAREENPPANTEALEWVLLTSEHLSTAHDVERVLQWYRLRWRIEVFHKAWKSGAGVERLRMQTGDNLLRMAVILAFVAVRLLQLREMFEQRLDASVERILTRLEWKILWISVEETSPPKKTPDAVWAYHALGRLAGWNDTKRTGVVGWDTLWKGWRELQQRVGTHEKVRQFGRDL